MFVKVTVLTVVFFFSNCHDTGDKRKQILVSLTTN